MSKEKQPQIWCDHCNADISFNSVKGCLRKTCQTKALLPEGVRK